MGARYLLVAIDEESGMVLSCEGHPGEVPLVQNMGHPSIQMGHGLEANLTLAVQESLKSMKMEAMHGTRIFFS